jgi:transcription antitermination factor NusG
MAKQCGPLVVRIMTISTGCSGSRFAMNEDDERRWFAVFTVPQNEQSTARHFDMLQIESFLPTYATVRVWKNRQRKTIMQPLFPTYLFVRIADRQRGRVLGTPGVLQIVGTRQQPLPVDNSEIEFLKTYCTVRRIEPFRDLVVGEPVRIKSGALKGLKGVLVRRNSNLRFVLTLEMINQNAAIEVDAGDLERA